MQNNQEFDPQEFDGNFHSVAPPMGNQACSMKPPDRSWQKNVERWEGVNVKCLQRLVQRTDRSRDRPRSVTPLCIQL